MEKRGKKDHYNPIPTPKKIIWVILAFLLGDILFSYSATLPSGLTIANAFFEPAVVSTSILFATASYLIISMVKK
jgi:uncharacterized membrane protein YhdT